MTRPKRTAADVIFLSLLALSAALYVATLHVVFFRAPVEKTMGIVQKIFYFHVPSAYSMYLGAATCFVGSVGYLIRPTDTWNAVGRAGAEVAVTFGAMMLISGPLWAAKAWGHYWTWDPRLTTALLSVLIYVAYLVLRRFTGDGEGERRFAAALGILGAANLPVIHYSVQKFGGQHPAVITGKGGGLHHPDMSLALRLSFLAFTCFVICLVWARARQLVLESRLVRAEEDLADLGFGDDSAEAT
jgi:heme exporter protein C